MKFTKPEVINDDEIRERQAQLFGLESQKTAVATMPMFPKDVSGLPHCIARSALFTPIRRGARRYCDAELIQSRDDVRIRYTGKQLDIADQDVFLQAIITAQSKPAGELCFFQRAEFLRELNRSDGKNDYLWLERSLERLQTGSVKVEGKKILVSTSLVASHGIDKEAQSFFVRLTPESVKFFLASYGHIDMAKRRLIRQDLAKWLQSYVSSHAKRERHFVTADHLHKISGSQTLLKKWKSEKLKPALAELQTLSIIRAVKITGNVVEWARI